MTYPRLHSELGLETQALDSGALSPCKSETVFKIGERSLGQNL